MKLLKYFTGLVTGMLLAATLSAQAPGCFELSKRLSVPDSTAAGLYSNAITDIRIQGDSLVWIGTGQGLSRIHSDSLTVATFYSQSGLTDNSLTGILPAGGVAALAVDGERIAMAVAGLTDGVSTGQGLAITTAAINGWRYFQQPVEAADDDSLVTWFGSRQFQALPVTVPQQNVTYDAAISGDYLWITSWSGGLRRYRFSTGVWQRIPLPLDDQAEFPTCDASLYEDGLLADYRLNPRDPISGSSNPWQSGEHNHKGFSVLAYGDTVWVGTANGINRGIVDNVNGCIDWEHYFYPDDNLSGNWVVSLARQVWNGRRVIWAVTLGTDSRENRGLSYSDDDGETWHTTLIGERAYNVAAFDSLVFAATDKGLWRSDDGHNWVLYRPARQSLPTVGGQVFLTDEITTDAVYSVLLDTVRTALWIGTGDGLARTTDLNGLNWRIFRVELDGVYAYPNPFQSGDGGDNYVRFHLEVEESYVIAMDIYNFAMELVYHEEFDRRDPDLGTYKWDGRDANARPVANGTYFIRMNYDNADHWLKLIVVR
ncbi:MAG: hypothetical protein ABIA75_06985 [Candidatus Neomarinimicrobiota bacterium]